MEGPPNSQPFSDLLSPFVDKHMRLRSGSETVGYVKSVGRVRFFSRDRYVWTGEPLDYTDSDYWTGYFDANRVPVYLNDLVLVREGVFQEDPTQAVVLEKGEKGMALRALKTGEEIPLQDPFSPKLGWNDLRVIGQAYRHPTLWKSLVEPETEEDEDFPPPTVLGGVHLVGWQMTLLAAVVALEWKWSGHVGPMLGCVGIWMGALLGLWRHRASNGPVLSRARVRHLASRSASGMAAIGCVAFVVFDLLGLTANALPQVLWWAPLLMGFTLGLVSLISVLTAADTFMAIVGGYDGSKKSVDSV